MDETYLINLKAKTIALWEQLIALKHLKTGIAPEGLAVPATLVAPMVTLV